jgi:two-component system sensor histidine kinase KdpD
VGGDPTTRRGTLRVYLGAAPGVGKTYAMLDEGQRRQARGTDVVVGYVEPHGRPLTEHQVDGLEVVPRRTLGYRDGRFEEMDLDAVLARQPSVALVDELAHTNVPGSRHEKRWQDVEELLSAGIDVITTVNIQHLESLNDIVESITGVRQQETVPDRVVRRADQIELVDMSPQALRRRLAHGNVYAAEKIDAAMTNYFRVGNLTALRELALLWTADRVDDALDSYRAEHGISTPWPARERVVVAVTGGPESLTLIRRGARITQRATGGELLVVHVGRSDGLVGAGAAELTGLRASTESLGGSWHSVAGEDTAQAILTFARGVNASQLVIGASRRSRLSSALSPGVGPSVVRESGDLDVYVVTHQGAGRGRRARRPHLLSRRRAIAGWVLAVLGPPILTWVLVRSQELHELSTELMLFLTLTVVVARVAGLWPALAAAVSCGLLANFFLTPPVHTWTVAEPENAFAILILVVVAAVVASVVHVADRQTREAARARAESHTLTLLAGSVLRGADALPALLEQLRVTFALDGVSVLERDEADGRWRVLGSVGDGVPTDPNDAATTVPVRDGLVLAARGRSLSADDVRVATAVAHQVDAVLERDRLRSEAARAEDERERTQIRTALLAAVSHDLRTPLAAIRAGISALTVADAGLAADDRAALLADVGSSADRLQALIDNLLDMSRLDAGAVHPVRDRVAVDTVTLAAINDLPQDRMEVDVAEDLPLIYGDAGLLERVIGNVVENALRYSPSDRPVLITAGHHRGRVVLRVIDRGPGVPAAQQEAIFSAFQRLGDAPSGQGVGLGLAVARGLAEATGASLEPEDTPGGGLTMVLTLPVAGAPSVISATPEGSAP